MASAQMWSSFCSLSCPPDAAAAAVAQTVALITSAALKQENLVRDGAAYVLSKDDSVRSRACQFLAQVIEGLPARAMEPSEGSVWLTFFITKLSDESCARHALHALAAVCATDCALSVDGIGQLPLRMCDAIHVPSQLQPSRHHALSIFKRVLSSPSVIPPPASRVVECLVTSIDAERDPRNLLVVFELVHIVASTPALHPLPSSLVEELFNATFRYFPIRFKRAANDIGSVSPDTLAVKLREALFSSTIFAPLLFMGLSQRIVGEDEDDDVIAALQCLNLSFKAFPATALAESADSLWGTLSHAAVDSASDKVAQACRDTVTCLLSAASSSQVAAAMITHAVSFASSAIRRPDEDGSRRTFRVFVCLIAAAESSDSADFASGVSSAIGNICSSLADAFLSCGSRPHAQLDVINMTLELVHALSLHPRVAAALPASVSGCLRDTLVSALTVPSSSDMALSAASGISLLVTSGIVTDSAASHAFTMLCDLALDVKGACSQAAATSSNDGAVPLHLHACRLVASCINSRGASSISANSPANSREQFETICKARVIPFVSAQLCAALAAPDARSPSAAVDDNAEVSNGPSRQFSPAVACITALCRCSSLIPAVVASFAPILIQHLKGATATELLIGMEAASGDDAGVAGGLFTDMILPCCSALSRDRQRASSGDEPVCPSIVALASLAAKCICMSCDQLASLAALYAALAIDSSFCELPPDASALIVTSCIVSLAVDTHTSLPVLNLCILLANSSMLLAPPGNQSLCAGAGEAIGSLVNKCAESVCAPAAAAAFDVLQHRVAAQQQCEAAAQCLAWIVRGLMARGHASAAEFEARMQQLLDREGGERALAVASGYAVLVSDRAQAVSAASSAACVVLWQQRYFNSTLASLLLMRSTRPSNGALLVAIAALCSTAPAAVLEPELPRVAGIIVESLKTMRSSVGVLDGTLQLLQHEQGVLSNQSVGSSGFRSRDSGAAVPSDPGSSGEAHVLRPHAASLVSSLLDVAAMCCVRLQCRALDCLLDIPSSIPYASLFPYKKTVAKALMQLLEHKKRAVRRRAGVARNVWMCMST